MTFKLLFLKEFDIDHALMESFSFTISIFTLLPEAKFTLKGTATELISSIKRGTPIDIVFSSGPNKYTVPMKVKSFSRNTAQKGTLADKMQVILVHELFFKESIRTQAWGDDKQVISEIVPTVLEKSYGKNYFNQVNISMTEEKPAIRYQLQESTLSFLNRLSTYAIKKDGPVYFFVDGQNNFNIIGFQERLMESPKYELIPFLEASTVSSEVAIPQNVLKQIPVLSYNIDTDAAKNNSISNVVFSVGNFRSIGGFNSSASFGGYELINGKAYSATPSSTEYLPWYYTPSDAFARTARNFTEQGIFTSYMAAYLSGFADNIELGTKVRFRMPMDELMQKRATNPDSILSESGDYLVFKISYIFRGTEFKTKVHLTDVTESLD